MTEPSTKEEYRRRAINVIHENGSYAVAKLDDTQIQVFINEETGDFSVFPIEDIEPYHVQSVYPLPDEGYFDCWALLSPRWEKVEI